LLVYIYEKDWSVYCFQACLAAIIVVALKGLVLQVKDVYTIGRVTKLEAVNRKET